MIEMHRYKIIFATQDGEKEIPVRSTSAYAAATNSLTMLPHVYGEEAADWSVLEVVEVDEDGDPLEDA